MKPSYKAILKALRALDKRGEIEFAIDVTPDETPIEGYASAVDEETDATQERWIRDQLASGNWYAWAHVTVRATWRGHHGFDNLGCCSYESEADFNAHCLPDMKHEAVIALAQSIATAYDDATFLINGGK